MTPFELNAYLDRIEWGRDTPPTLDTVGALLQAHMMHIPFENLDVLLGRPVRLDLDGLRDKLVRARRGGYCFEHMTLFAAVLEALGFRPVRHSARVVLRLPRTESPRTHMFLTLAVKDETFVLDPAFGGTAAALPIPLIECAPSGPGDATHWMVREGGYWIMRHLVGGRHTDGWVSTLEQDYPADFELASHFTATHPSSGFVNHLMLSVLKPDGRIGIIDRDVTVRRGGDIQSFQIADRAALRAILTEHFGFDLPDVEGLRVPMIPEWNPP